MKTNYLLCPTCGAILEVKLNDTKVECKYCGNTVLLSNDENGSNILSTKPLLSQLIENKYIYYIPSFDGINDCYDFLMNFGEAVFLYEKRKSKLNEKEDLLVREFFDRSHEYISNCINKNLNKMIFSDVENFYYALRVFSNHKFSFIDFTDLESVLQSQLRKMRKPHKIKCTLKKLKITFYVILMIIIFFCIFVLPGILASYCG